jgi:hypothetical protein
MRLPATLLVLSCIAMLGGCASPLSLVPGQSTVADARARAGTPTDTQVDRNGDQLWEYATGPEGFETYQVRIGTDGKVKEVTQILTEEQLAKVVPGKMTKADVRILLGRPAEETIYRAGLTWSWRFRRLGVQPGYLVVTFNPDNTVKDKIAIIDMSDDSDRDK